MKITKVEGLANIANDIRIEIIEQVYNANSGHPGGSLSCADILAVLYFNQMNIDSENPNAKGRDRFVLSKGHCAPALYATLARKGYFDKELLKGFRKVESNLQGHPDMKKVPGVDMSTGSLGQDYQQRWEWQLVQRWNMRDTEYIVYLEMENSKKDKYGKQQCLQVKIN